MQREYQWDHKHHQPGAPNEGFLLNTLKILYTFRCLEVYSERRYKICICSTILVELESFRSKLQGLVFSIQYFPENVRCNLKYYKSETFSDLFLHCIFGSGTDFRFPFPYEKWPNLRFIQKSQPSSSQWQKILGNNCFSKQIFHRKQSSLTSENQGHLHRKKAKWNTGSLTQSISPYEGH